MADENANVREALATIRAELDRRGMHLKVCAAKGGFSYSTFLSWFPASGTPQVPSLANLPGLVKALPSDLVSLLVPDGFHLIPDPQGLDYDAFAAGCVAFLERKNKAHHPDSPAGRDLSDCEKQALTAEIVRLPIVRGAA